MNILAYLESHSLEDLTAELGIKVAQNEKYPDLYCLNYCQIKSPKTNPIVKECRSLVLEIKYIDSVRKTECRIISRSFDRFFNYGEAGTGDDMKPNEMIAYEKVDGSLVGLFYYIVLDLQYQYQTKYN